MQLTDTNNQPDYDIADIVNNPYLLSELDREQLEILEDQLDADIEYLEQDLEEKQALADLIRASLEELEESSEEEESEEGSESEGAQPGPRPNEPNGKLRLTMHRVRSVA